MFVLVSIYQDSILGTSLLSHTHIPKKLPKKGIPTKETPPSVAFGVWGAVGGGGGEMGVGQSPCEKLQRRFSLAKITPGCTQFHAAAVEPGASAARTEGSYFQMMSEMLMMPCWLVLGVMFDDSW